MTENVRPERSSPLRSAAVAVVALLVATVGGYTAWKAFGSTGSQLAGKNGYFLRLPEAANPPGDDPDNRGATVPVVTNLPDGTRVLIEEEHVGGSVHWLTGTQCCPPVKEGMLIAHISSPECMVPPGGKARAGFRVTLTVAPDATVLFRCLSFNCGSEQQQPKEILEILGPRFENVRGDQVTTIQGMRAIVATGTYEWPEGACAGFLDSPERLPEDCRPGTPPIVWERADLVPGDTIGALTQLQICMLWNYGTEAFREAHPWPEFKDTVTAWIEELGPLTSPEGPYEGETYLTTRLTQESAETFSFDGKELPERLVAEYLYRSRPVAEAEFVHIANSNPNVVPEWEIARFDILQGG